jgi:hypothetical protein
VQSYHVDGKDGTTKVFMEDKVWKAAVHIDR